MIKDAAIDRAENQLIEAFRLLGIYRTLAEKTPRLYTHHWQITIGMVARSQQHLNNTIADTSSKSRHGRTQTPQRLNGSGGKMLELTRK